MSFYIDPKRITEARTDYWTPGRGTVDPSAQQNPDGSFTWDLKNTAATGGSGGSGGSGDGDGDGDNEYRTPSFKQTSNLPDPFHRVAYGSNAGKLMFNDKIAGENRFYNPNQQFIADEYFNQNSRNQVNFTTAQLEKASEEGQSLIEKLLEQYVKI